MCFLCNDYRHIQNEKYTTKLHFFYSKKYDNDGSKELSESNFKLKKEKRKEKRITFLFHSKKYYSNISQEFSEANFKLKKKRKILSSERLLMTPDKSQAAVSARRVIVQLGQIPTKLSMEWSEGRKGRCIITRKIESPKWSQERNFLPALRSGAGRKLAVRRRRDREWRGTVRAGLVGSRLHPRARGNVSIPSYDSVALFYPVAQFFF